MIKYRKIWSIAVLSLVLCGSTCYAAEQDESEQTGDTSYEETTVDVEEVEAVQNEVEQAILGELDFSEIDNSLSNLMPDEKIRFEDVVSTLVSGDFQDIGSMLLQFIRDQLSYEFRANKQNLVHILMIAVTAAVFANFSSAIQSRQVSEMGFFVLYLLLVTLCLNTFKVAVSGVEEHLENVLDFMRVFCPGYFLSMAISVGSSSAVWFYNLVLLLIFLTEILLLRFLIPVIHVYIVVQVMNHLFPEEILGKMAALLKKFVGWFLKTTLGIVIGINIVQGLIAPAADVLKRSTVTKTIESLPGIGNMFGSATDVVLGTAVLLKNGIGMAGAIILILICAVPVIQMGLLVLLYQLTAAVVQPVSDKRVTECISSVGEGYELIMKVMLTTVGLFLLTIAIAAAATS